MIKTIIIDDEQHCIDAILNLMQLFPNTFNVVGTYTNIDEAVTKTQILKPDLVFLDVEVNNKTGFDYLQAIQHPNFQIIFTTAHDKYAVKAFKFSALDYLLKPIDDTDFKEAILKMKQRDHNKVLEQKMDAFFFNMKANHFEKRITINTKTDFNVLSVSDILYCKSSINYTDIFSKTHGKITSSKTLKYYTELLLESDFYRVDQSYLVNLRYIKKYTKGKPAYVILSDGTKIKVSLSNKDGFFEQLNNLHR